MINSLFRDNIDRSTHVVATYDIRSKTTVKEAAYCIAIGQSIGNPSIRSTLETADMLEQHAAKITMRHDGLVNIGFPLNNFDAGGADGVSQLMCVLMGGHLDIDLITYCQLVDIHVPNAVKWFAGPRYGISGIREYIGVKDKPLLGGIIKPKTGITPTQLLDITKQLVEGGVNFIKEDELLANPACCPFNERVELISDYIRDKNVIFAHCVNSDFPHIIDRVRMVHQLGGNAVHANIWCGLGVYQTIRKMDLPLFLFFQKSGDRIMTNESHAFNIHWNVMCKLAAAIGVDFIHAGMWGGYSSCDEDGLTETLKVLQSGNVMPSLSCGMHPGLVDAVTRRFGYDYMANVGGAIHGHPGGTLAGAKAMKQAIDGQRGSECDQAIEKWGKVD